MTANAMTEEISAEQCIVLAHEALKKERLGTALDWYYDAVTKCPEKPEYRAEMVTAALIPMGMEKHAFVEAVRAIHIDEKCAKAWRALGCAENCLGNITHAIQSFDKQLALAPNEPQAMLDRAGLALDVADWELATRLCRKILETENIYGGDALHFLALAAYRQGKHEEAIELDDWAIEGKCHYPEVARWNQSLALLALGRFKEGWEKHLSRRNSAGDIYSMEHFRRFKKPLFEFQGPGTIHITQEMGFGDCLIMLRYLPLLVAQGYKVQLEVDSALEGLLKHSFPDVHVMRKAPNYPGILGIPDFDYHLPLLNCPLIFKTEVETIPWNGSYIKADPVLVEKYKLNTRAKRKIGVCWSSGLFTQGVNARWHGEFNRRKSVGIENLKPLFEAYRDDLFVSLQVGPTRKEGEGYVLDVLPENPDWSHTAALIENLDLVITVDTGVAHLTGAMGKPFLLMMHSEGTWQWFAERPNSPWNEKSPWYPSARLIRQKKPHEWGEVVSKLLTLLSKQELVAA